MKTKALVLFVMTGLVLWALAAVAAPPQTEHALKVGKKGEITLTQPTKVGDKILQPDTYVVQHRVSGNDHFVRFIELKQLEAHAGEIGEQAHYTYTEADKAGELKCKVESAAAPVKQTTVYTTTEGGMPRITKVAIKGEGVWHVF